MPKNEAERKMLAAMLKQYGSKKGQQVFHATLNKRRSRRKRNFQAPRLAGGE